MDRLVLTYHPDAAFAAGRLADRLTLRMGEEAITVVDPDDGADPEALSGLFARHQALLVVVPAEADGRRPADRAAVHLPVSVAIRAGRPITMIELRPGSEGGTELAGPPDDGSGIAHLDVDPDRLDEASARLIAHVERWLSGTRVIPRIEFEPTMVPAFVGITGRLPTDAPRAPRSITNWRQFEASYGGFAKDALLPLAVYGWFANGGRGCYIAPIQPVEPDVPDDAAEPTRLHPSDHVGSETEPSGIRGLVHADDVTALVLPDLVTVCRLDDGSIDLEHWKAVQTAAIADAESHNRIALLDPPPGMPPLALRDWRLADAMYDSRAACLHYPWILAPNPSGESTGHEQIVLPPSGHIAGVWARSDRERAVWRSPANQVVMGAIGTERELSANERFVLATTGINPFRLLGPDGIRIWGSSTLSSDPWFASLEVSRFAVATLRACSAGLRWAAFEPDTAATRSAATRQLEEFLAGLWRAGALVGTTQPEAFTVEWEDEQETAGLDVRITLQPAAGVFVRLGIGRRYGESGAVLG